MKLFAKVRDKMSPECKFYKMWSARGKFNDVQTQAVQASSIVENFQFLGTVSVRNVAKD